MVEQWGSWMECMASNPCSSRKLISRGLMKRAIPRSSSAVVWATRKWYARAPHTRTIHMLAWINQDAELHDTLYACI